MKQCRPFHFFTAPTLAVLAIMFASTLRAEPPAAPGPVIERGVSDNDWQWLFSALAARSNTFASFTEKRSFAARKTPVELRGEMRLDPAHGLSLHYTAPEETLTVIDSRGLYLRDAKGRITEIKAGTHDAGLVAALLPVMRFDEENLFKNFVVRAARNSAEWRLDFMPRNEKLAGALGSITVTGIGTEIKKLSFNASPKIRVEVFVGEARHGITFSGDELKKYYR